MTTSKKSYKKIILIQSNLECLALSNLKNEPTLKSVAAEILKSDDISTINIGKATKAFQA
jgi:hypothetical protein